MQPFAGVYTRKDRIGRHWEAGYPVCCKRPRLCAACENCLIHVGDQHHEQLLDEVPLPVLTDVFDEGEGIWYRGIIWQDRDVCSRCVEDFEFDRFQPTLRLAPIAARIREERVRCWAAARGVPPPRRGRHVGGFVRRQNEEGAWNYGEV